MSDDLEIKALLANSGEAELTSEELARTQTWRHDAGRIADLARAALAEPPPAASAVRSLCRVAAQRQAMRLRLRRQVWWLAAAATLLLLAGGGSIRLAEWRDRARLERLDNVLALLESSSIAAAQGHITREALSDRLVRLQSDFVEGE
ncbi:MAG: hypothetical protein PHR35_19935 [Kiritimatiellae bacterium]|nr:hypothetical protein [Kiritimatiellia bacterium]